jgi:hypothetical protein
MLRHISSHIGVACLLLLAFGAVGCSSGGGGSKDMTAWQRSVEQYIHDRGDDPAVLRDVTLEDNRPGFAVIGGLDPAKSTDARAVLLGHKTINDKPWFIYLVGIVERQKVQEIRLAALSASPSGGQYTWRLGPPDTHALKLYRDWGWTEWKKHSADARAKPPPEYTTFPRAFDQFELKVEGTRITATHKESGAAWIDDVVGSASAGKKK